MQTGSADRTHSPARSNDKKYPGLEFNGTNRLNKRINKGNHPEDEWESYWDQADDNQIQGNSLEGIDNKTIKGQIKPKSVWARQKTNERICFVCLEKQKSKQNKFVRSFFGRIYGAPKLLLVLSDL